MLDGALREKWGDVVVLKIPHNKGKEKVLIEELIKYEILFQKLNAEHIVRYLGFELFRNQYVIVMEYLDGFDLARLISERRVLPVDIVVNFACQICAGLLEAHQARIIHRDIKPANILIDSQPKKVKLADFGIARLLKENEVAHTMTGTFAYMAPEVINGEASFSSDIYSVCATIYEMLTGKLPITGTTIEEIIHNTRYKKPQRPKSYNPEIPGRLDDAVMKGLQKNPADRFKAIEELQSAIRNCNAIGNPKAEIKLAWKLFREGEIEKAEASFREILHNFPDDVDSYLNVAEFYNRCNNHIMSLRVLRKGLNLNPTNALLHWSVAMVHQQRGNTHDAIEMLRKALSLRLSEKMQVHGKVLLDLWSRAG